MSELTIKVHNVETGEVIEREMNEAEIAALETSRLAHLVEKASIEEAQAKKAALLEKLGITQEEANLLLG